MRKKTLLLTVALLLAACGPAVDPATLPDVPTVNTVNYQSGVRAQLDEAVAAFDAAPTSAKRNGHLGMLFRAYRDFDASTALFERASALAPRNLDWQYYYAESLEQQGRNDEALAAFQSVLTRAPSDVPSRLHAARMLLATGQVQEALTMALAAKEAQPRAGDAYVLVAEALTRAGRVDEAVMAWEEALSEFGGFRNGHYALAQLYRRVGRRTDAERQLWLFETTGRESPPAFDPRLVELFKLNVSDRALVRAAQAAKRRGEVEQALALLEQALERNPDNLETRASLVSGYTTQAQFDDAQRHADAGLAQDPDHVALGVAAARLALARGRSKDALAQLRQTVSRSPKHAEARAWLGRVHEIRGRKADAGRHYAAAVAIDPAQASARRLYMNWLVSNETPERVVDVLSSLVDTPSRDAPLAYLALAQGYARLGDRDAALAALDTGMERARWLGLSRQERQLAERRAALVAGVTP
ncbi:MAG: tetratricopeptide repeat protein [Pseudomonadota bacterium]